MALDDIPNKLLQFLMLHDTCPQQLHQAVLHPEYQSQEIEVEDREMRCNLIIDFRWIPC